MNEKMNVTIYRINAPKNSYKEYGAEQLINKLLNEQHTKFLIEYHQTRSAFMRCIT